MVRAPEGHMPLPACPDAEQREAANATSRPPMVTARPRSRTPVIRGWWRQLNCSPKKSTMACHERSSVRLVVLDAGHAHGHWPARVGEAVGGAAVEDHRPVNVAGAHLLLEGQALLGRDDRVLGTDSARGFLAVMFCLASFGPGGGQAEVEPDDGP